ncbi:unnamed protein product [Rhizophagus irregularis]|nr:unnamed protein product [Rhizophagus irregularis]
MDFQQKKLLLDFTTVYKIRRIYDHWGYVTHPFKGRQGRRKTLNLVDLNILVSLNTQTSWNNKKKVTKAAKERNGFIAADFIEGSCNKERFQTFILTQVLPQMNEYPNKNSVIVMDNANFSSR